VCVTRRQIARDAKKIKAYLKEEMSAAMEKARQERAQVSAQHYDTAH
jgi:transcriptional antiterminator